MTSQAQAENRLSTGVAGLDEILSGGFLGGRSYLVRGGPGTGKTTLGLHFLAAGVAGGERCLYISLEETEARIRAHAGLRGLAIEPVTVLDISPSSGLLADGGSYDVFSPAEVEREPLMRRIIDLVEAARPERVFLDPVTQFRYLSSDAFHYRRQIVSLLRFLAEQGATVLFTSEKNATLPDDDLQFMSDGVIDIDRAPHGLTVGVTKLRGSGFRGGVHTLRLVEEGMTVYPRLEPIPQRAEFVYQTISSGLAFVDALLGGGIEHGATTLISGPTGVGKTTLGMQFLSAAAGHGERSVIYAFEEDPTMILQRCDGIGLPTRAMIEKGLLRIRPVEPLRFTPDEFAELVREDVERAGTRIVMLDSISGYMLSLRGEDLRERVHALSKYLQNLGVAVIIINEQETIVGDFRATESGLSYLADNMVFLRYLEMRGEISRAIGVLKKRLGDFEKTLREFRITPSGIRVGEPLVGLRGVLRGMPEEISAGLAGDSRAED